MNTRIVSLVVCLFLSCVYSNTLQAGEKKGKKNKYNGYKLVWAEEFNKKGLPDARYWDYESGYVRNNELQDYKKADTKYTCVKNGKLILEAHPDPHEGVQKGSGEPYQFEYSSGSIRTLHKVPFKYGRIDISAKIPTGRGVWPAIWLMPVNSKYGGWPRSGEIDVMEYVWGNDAGHKTVYGTVHTEDSQLNGNKIKSGTTESNTLSTEFHLYSLIWKEDKIEILFDDQVIFTYGKTSNSSVKWPFDQEFYLIMNIAVGGSWGGVWGIDESIFPTRMEVDYVRYYEEIEEN